MLDVGLGEGSGARQGAEPGLEVVCLTTLTELAALRDEWNALASVCATATIFQTWEWVTTWYHCFGASATLRVFCVRDGADRLVGVAPFILRRSTVGVRHLHLLGPGLHLTEYVDALYDPRLARPVAKAIFDAWDRMRSEWDILLLVLVPAESEFLQEVRALAGAHRYATVQWQNMGVQRALPASWQGFYGSLRRPMKTYLNNMANRLQRGGHRARMVVVNTPAELDEAIGLLVRWHRQRARLARERRHIDYFAHEPRPAFLRAVTRRLLERDQCWLCVLYVDDLPVAVQLCFVHSGVLYRHYSGYDPAWAWYGVMATLFRHCVAHAIAQGCASVDLLLDANQEKLRWGGEPRAVASLTLAHPGLRSRAGFGWYGLHGFLRHRLPDALRGWVRRRNAVRARAVGAPTSRVGGG